MSNLTRWCACSAAFILTLLAGCAAQRLHSDGIAAIERGDYEKGVADLTQAVARDPSNMVYLMDLQVRRDSAVQSLIAEGDAALSAGQLDAAAALYQRVLTINPANNRASHALLGIEADRRHGEELEIARKDFERKDYDAAEAKLHAILAESPGYVPAQQLAAKINFARGPVTVAPRLKTRDNRKVTLQLRDAPTKMVFEVLQRETGINFVLDKDVKSDSKTSIFVQDVPVEEAIDLVLEQNQLARQILADNMVLIYPNVAAKQKEYEQQMVRSFYLTNAPPKDVESMLKSVLGAKVMYVDERASVLVMRDTPDAVRMAEKLVAAIDVAEPEVMLEVEVLEISRSKVQDLGVLYPGSVTFTPTPSGTSGLVLGDLGKQTKDTIQISNISATLNAMKQTGQVNTLASPRIRARNKEKAKVLIGTREPVITNTTTPTSGGPAVVTGSVQYLDVGLTLEVQPTVYPDSDVAIKINLEVSNLLKQITTSSGTIAYEIGTRNANTLLRLRDGETQILAGLIQDSDTRSATSIPGLGDIPILSHLFGTHHTDREKDEIVLSITPRIIRMQAHAPGEMTEFWYGSETHTRGAPYSAEPGGSAQPQAPADPTRMNMQPAIPNPGQPSAVPQTSVPASGAAPPQTSVTPASAAAATLLAEAALAASQHSLAATAPPATIPSNASGPQGGGDAGALAPSALTLEGPNEAKVGEEFEVVVRLATDESITHLRSQLRFEAAALQLLSAETGNMVPAAAGSPKVNTRPGGAQLDVTTTSDSPVQGQGSLMTLQFKAVAPRSATNIQANLNVLGGSGAATANSTAPPLTIAIRPAG